MNLLPTYPPVADRYAQLPLVALCPLVLAPALIRLPPAGRMAATAILVAGLSLLTSLQLSNWRNDETLLTHAVQMNPGATQALGNLALVLGERGRHDEALRVAETLGRLQPEGFHGAYLRGLRAFQEGRLAEAEVWLETATKKKGQPHFISWAALGQVYEQRNRPEAARRAYRNALDRLSGQPHYASQRREIEERLRQLQLRRR
jgi:Flp pilus assembly protein TadD